MTIPLTPTQIADFQDVLADGIAHGQILLIVRTPEGVRMAAANLSAVDITCMFTTAIVAAGKTAESQGGDILTEVAI